MTGNAKSSLRQAARVVELLVGAGADVDGPGGADGATPLYIASGYGFEALSRARGGAGSSFS